MIKQFLIRITVAAVFLLFFSLRFVDATISEAVWEHPLESGWKATGLILEAVDTETWTKLANSWMSVVELQKVARVVAAKLRLRSESDWISGIQDHYSYISFEGTRPDRTRVIVTIQSCRDDRQSETQIGIYTSKPNPSAGLRTYLGHLQAAIAGVAKDCHTRIFLIGKYQGEMKRPQIQELSRRVFRKLDAQLIEVDYPAPGNSIYRGYTPALLKNPDGLYCSNFEFCTKYDSEEAVTQVQLAAPSSDEGV